MTGGTVRWKKYGPETVPRAESPPGMLEAKTLLLTTAADPAMPEVMGFAAPVICEAAELVFPIARKG